MILKMKTKKSEINILLIGVILVALATVGTLFYSILYKPAPSVTDYAFDEAEFAGNQKTLVGDEPVVEEPSEIPVISITGFVVGAKDNEGIIIEKNEFELGEPITISTQVEKFKQPAINDGYGYGLEQWIATQNEDGEYVNALTGMTANFSKFVQTPEKNIELTNQLDTAYLSPGTYTVKVFYVDRFTQDIDLAEKEIIII